MLFEILKDSELFLTDPVRDGAECSRGINSHPDGQGICDLNPRKSEGQLLLNPGESEAEPFLTGI